MFHRSLDDYIPPGGLCGLSFWVDSQSPPTPVFLRVLLRRLRKAEVGVPPGTLSSAENSAGLVLVSQMCFAGHSRNVNRGKNGQYKHITAPGKIARSTLFTMSLLPKM